MSFFHLAHLLCVFVIPKSYACGIWGKKIQVRYRINCNSLFLTIRGTVKAWVSSKGCFIERNGIQISARKGGWEVKRAVECVYRQWGENVEQRSRVIKGMLGALGERGEVSNRELNREQWGWGLHKLGPNYFFGPNLCKNLDQDVCYLNVFRHFNV